MTRAKPGIAPDEIRNIRQRLGLTQVEAGELIGGGPRAFTKYESGTVKPTTAVVKLLRLLEANPNAIPNLKGDKARPNISGGTSPFEVTGEDIAALTERVLSLLLRRLLSGEAEANNIPPRGIHVASGIHTPDAGEDGRISWEGGPERTPFLPSRLCQFQLKAGSVSPVVAARDVIATGGAVKSMVRAVLDDGGHYIMLSARPYTQKQIQARKNRIRQALRRAGLAIADDRVDFRDADQIATWTNHHPSVALWVLERTQPGTIGPFRSWNHWAGHADHDRSPWVEDERLPPLQTRLREQVTEPRNAVRVVGLSGVGKSRLVLEALGPTEEEEASGRFISNIVMYGVQSEVGREPINRVVQSLADLGRRAVVVVDDCDPENHRVLTGMVLRSNSRLSLITIDYEIPSGTLDEATLKVDKAPTSVIEDIIHQITPGLPSEDQSRLVRFSRGFPKVAINIAQAWLRQTPIAHATEDDLVGAFVLGRRSRDSGLLLKSAALLAAFGLVRIDPPADSQLHEIARFGRNLSGDDLHAATVDLVERGIALRRGGLFTLQPMPIAMRLAERQWKAWAAHQWDEVLAGETSLELGIRAARQLALLNTTEVSQEVVDYVCRVGGPFDYSASDFRAEHAAVLSSLAGIDPEITVDQIERSLNRFADMSEVRGDVRRHLVVALEKVAFHPHTFEHGALLLLGLAVAENEYWDNNATGQFKALFPIYLGNTAADGDARHSLLSEIAEANDPTQRLIVVEALIAGSETHHFHRMVGVEVQGSRPALAPWHPATAKEASDYIRGCVERLAQFALASDQAGTRARSGLGEALRSLVGSGFIDTVEKVVHEVVPALATWPQAMESLNHVLIYDADSTDREVICRVQALIAALQPTSLEARIRFLISETPWDYHEDQELDLEAQYQRRIVRVRELTRELLRQPDVLSAALSQLSCGRQQMANALGVAVAEFADSPCEWLGPIVRAVVDAPEAERNYDLLSGFVLGLAKTYPEAADTFKGSVVRSPELAPGFPQICARLGITASDIEKAVGALQEGLLPPYRLNQWTLGRALDDVPATALALLFNTMLDHSAEAFAVAVELMGMYAYGTTERLEGLRPQIHRLASNLSRWANTSGQRIRFTPMWEHHFERIMGWMLSRGRQDPDASATALALGKAMCNVETLRLGGIGEGRVVSTLLSNFPEVVWPLLGQAIVSDRQRAFLFRLELGHASRIARETKPAILSLPEDTLFAWCHAHPGYAPAFAAGVLPVISSHDADDPERSLHPVMARLLDEFGEREDVQQAVGHNIGTFGWSGSTTTYYALYEQPLNSLLEHAKPKVRRWAKAMIRQLHREVDRARNFDEELDAQWEV